MATSSPTKKGGRSSTSTGEKPAEPLNVPFFHLVQPISSDILVAIGAVTVAWGGVETLVDQAIARVLRLSGPEQAALTVGVGFKFRLDMLRDLVKARRMPKLRRADISDIIAKIEKVQGDRNFLAHALWMRDGPLHVSGYVGRRNAQGYRAEKWDAQRILRIAHDVADAETELFWWVHLRAKHRLVRASSPQRGA